MDEFHIGGVRFVKYDFGSVLPKTKPQTPTFRFSKFEVSLVQFLENPNANIFIRFRTPLFRMYMMNVKINLTGSSSVQQHSVEVMTLSIYLSIFLSISPSLSPPSIPLSLSLSLSSSQGGHHRNPLQ